MKSSPINVGIVGCGWIMRSTYTPALLSLRDSIRVAAICDLNEEAVRATAAQLSDASAFNDVREMLKTAKLDAVMVLTSEKVNAAMAQLVLKAGLPVYLEKPPAVSSLQLEELVAAEAQSQSFIYTAFNRRHTPLYARFDLKGEKLLRISGALRRRNRAVATFPHTSIHLIDSAQFFARSSFQKWKIEFETGEHSTWKVEGKLENGAEFALEFVPDGNDFAEYLVLETTNRRWELPFPNADAAVPEGELIEAAADGSPMSRVHGEKTLAPFEAMGFRACLLDFAGRVEAQQPSPIHRLTQCKATIRVIEEMETLCKDK